MRNLFDSGISVEKMAAYLDGNLSQDEMQSMSSMINNDSTLHHFVDQSNAIDDSISAFTASDYELPQELQSSDFHIPSLDNVSSHEFVTLTPQPIEDDLMTAACAAHNPVDDLHPYIDPTHNGDHNPFDDDHLGGHKPWYHHDDDDNIGTMGHDDENIGDMNHDDGTGYNGEDY